MKLELTQRLLQQQILAPQMILSMDVLLLTVAELENRIEKELEENPALEIAEPTGAEKQEVQAPAPDPASAESEQVFDKIHAFEERYGHRSYEERPARSRWSETGPR